MKLPLQVAALTSRDGTITKDSLLKNGIFEKSGDDLIIRRRPGLLDYGTFTGSGRGMAVLKDNSDLERLFVASGSAIYAESQVLTAGSATAFTARGEPTSPNSRIFNRPVLLRYSGLLWAIGSGGTASGAGTHFLVAYSQDNGVTWNFVTEVADGTSGYPDPLIGGTAQTYFGCVFNDLIYIVGRSGTSCRVVWHTADGVNWTQDGTDWGGGTAYTCDGVVAHSSGSLIMVVRDAASGNSVLTSADGTGTWSVTAATPAFEASNTLQGEAFVSFGGNLYVIGGTTSASNGGKKVYRSTDNGATWAELGTNVLSFANANTNLMCAVMDGPACYLLTFLVSTTVQFRLDYSLDFQTWNNLITDTTLALVNPSNINNGPRFAMINNTAVLEYQGTDDSGFDEIATLTLTNNGSQNISIGNVAGTFFDFAQNYVRTIVAFKSEGAAYTLNPIYGVVTRVTDAQYPNLTARGLVYLDGYFFVMDRDGNIWNSANEDFTSWAATDFIAAEFEPDGGVAIGKYLNNIIAFGQYTIEMFYDAGNASGSPLSPVQNGVMTVGCAHANSIQTVDNKLLFIGQTKSSGQAAAKGRFIAVMDGMSYTRVSTADVDRILDTDDLASVDSMVARIGGHALYVVNLRTTGVSLVYDMSEGTWQVFSQRRTSATQLTSNPIIIGTNGTATQTTTLSGSDGDVIVVSAFTGTNTVMNGTFNAIVPAAGTFCWNVGTAISGTFTETGTVTTWSEAPFPGVAAVLYANKQLVQDVSNGLVYNFNPGTYQDRLVYMDLIMRAAGIDHGTIKPKFQAYAAMKGDKLSANALYRYSDDDCTNFSLYRPASMNIDTTRWNRGGTFNKRAHQVRITDNVAARILAFETEVGL